MKVDIDYFRRFYQKRFELDFEEQEIPLATALRNMRLMVGEELNTAGLLLFGADPMPLIPSYHIKCVTYPGTDIHVEEYIEIISPGHLPNNLTVDNIRSGNSNIRNPVLASYGTSVLPYRGLGNGIVRALREYPDIDFVDDREANRFVAIVRRRYPVVASTGSV